jgi:ketol-acid reductoisomerase
VCLKCPGSEVREEYKRGFEFHLIAYVHPEKILRMLFCSSKKLYAVATGGHKAGVLNFLVASKIGFNGRATILLECQTGSILCFDKMVEKELNQLMLKINSIRLGNSNRSFENTAGLLI